MNLANVEKADEIQDTKPEGKKGTLGKEENAEPSARCPRDAKPGITCWMDTSQQGYPTGAEMSTTKG